MPQALSQIDVRCSAHPIARGGRTSLDSRLFPVLTALAATIALLAPGCGQDSPAPAAAQADSSGKEHHHKDKDKQDQVADEQLHGRAGRAAEALADDRLSQADRAEDAGKSGTPSVTAAPASAAAPVAPAPTSSAAASGAAPAYYVSMHGASGGNTLSGIAADGRVVASVLNGAPQGAGGAGAAGGGAGDTLKNLRGLCLLDDGKLLVVNAWLEDTRIVQYGVAAADGTRTFEKVFIQGGQGNAALQHTYCVVIGPDGNVYCSNQDSNTVTRYSGPSSSNPGQPLPPPSAIAHIAELAPGVFVPDAKASPHGIHGARGITFGPDKLLYVADRDAGKVSSYDTATGERKEVVVDKKHGLKQPIQLAFSTDGNFLYVGDDGANCVWRKDLEQGTVTTFIEPKTGGLDAPSALLIQGDRLYVGNRLGKSVLCFSLPDGKLAAALVQNLSDNPEFLIPSH